VANDGPTVPPADLDRLFEPFQRLTPTRTAKGDGHHGLGLSIVRAIATAHAATLTATPRPEGGLTIEVKFAWLPPTRSGYRSDPPTEGADHEQ
jgi:signal transduction histidine kinase